MTEFDTAQTYTRHKPWTRSRTIWFNIATGLIGIGVEFAAFVDFLPEDVQHPVRGLLAVLVAVGNVVLRVLTSEPVGK